MTSLVKRLRSLDPVIVGTVLCLCTVGMIMLMSASGPSAFLRTGDRLFFVIRQLTRGFLPGMLLFFFFAFIDFRIWKRFASVALGLSIALLILVYIPGLGQRIGGSLSWVKLGPITFQPSEFVKFTFLLYLSAWLANRKGSDAHKLETGFIPFLGALCAVVLLLVMQPDTGSMAVIVMTSLILYFLSGAPWAWFVGLTAMGFAGIALLIKASPYRAARFMTFLHPEIDPKGIGYQINQAILAIGTGGWFGLGYGHSRQKYLYLPEVESDSIIAIIAEEMGFVALVALLVVFGVLIWRCFWIAKESKNRFGMYLSAGFGGWLFVQTVLNIGSMTGLLPMTGVTLPFISYGGSSLLVLLAMAGLVAGIPLHSQERE